MKRYIISLLSIILILGIIASATSVSITIWGTNGNASGAQQNVTKYNANNSVNVSAWNTTKTIMVRSLNASGDIVSFNISNMTAWRMYELKVNGTSVNGYQARENGMVNFTYSQNNSNVTYSLSPAINSNGLNITWARIWDSSTNVTNKTTAAFGTVYQNNEKSMKIISVTWLCVSGATPTDIYSDEANPPTLKRTARKCGSGAPIDGVTFVVMPYHYYYITSGETLNLWEEWT